MKPNMKVILTMLEGYEGLLDVLSAGMGMKYDPAMMAEIGKEVHLQIKLLEEELNNSKEN